MAEAFSTRVPEDVSTPADLQDYLLTQEKEPQHTIDAFADFEAKELEIWRKKEADDLTEAKAKENTNEATTPAAATAAAADGKSLISSVSGYGGLKFW